MTAQVRGPMAARTAIGSPNGTKPTPPIRGANISGHEEQGPTEVKRTHNHVLLTFNFFFKLNYNKTFDVILSTPLGPDDIALGELGWAHIRGGLYAIGFLIVMGLFGLIVSPWVILAFPAHC